MNQKKKTPLRWLLLIPIQLILDGLLFAVAVYLDTSVVPNPNALGHPVPAFTLIAAIVLSLVTVIVVILALILTITGFIQARASDQAS